MSRTVAEWIGKTDDERPPPRVRLRVFERCKGVCHLSGIKIGPADKWECDHVVALILGGENRETNLAPALVDRHKVKTANDVAQKAKNDAVRKKHLGIRKPSRFACSRDGKWKKRVDGTVVLRG